MARTSFTTIDEYIRTVPTHAQPVVEAIRQTIRKAVPKASETISYQMPAFTLEGRAFIYFGGYKQHVSLYPATGDLLTAVPEVAPYVVSKGTIKFPLDKRLPVGLITKIAKFKAKEHLARLNSLCFLPCSEYTDLKKAIEQYEKSGKTSSRGGTW